jgi:LemA protein
VNQDGRIRSLRKGTIILIVAVVLLGLWGVVSYNGLVKLDQGVQGQWAQVENAYQRRADLVPNLVETVKGVAKHERETLERVTEARARVGQVTATASAEDLRAFQAAQAELSSALGRLIAVAEAYPELKATEAFRDLMVQLEGTENRISVERMRFNEAARAYNERRKTFPTVMIAGFLGFDDRPYFEAAPGAEKVPKVEF